MNTAAKVLLDNLDLADYAIQVVQGGDCAEFKAVSDFQEFLEEWDGADLEVQAVTLSGLIVCVVCIDGVVSCKAIVSAMDDVALVACIKAFDALIG